MEEILDQMQMNVCLTDIETYEVLFMNKKMKENYQLVRPEGKRCWELLHGNAEKCCEHCQVSALCNPPKEGAMIRWRWNDTEKEKVYDICDSLISWQGRLVHMHQSYDITEILHLAKNDTKDELSGVWNRSKGKAMLRSSLKNLSGAQNCLMILLDIDGLQNINELYGTVEGDNVLKTVGGFLSGKLQEPEFVFRLSGNTFVVVLYNIETQEAECKAQKWRRELEYLSEQQKKSYVISFSYGISSVYAGGRYTEKELLDWADEEMYAEKLRRRKDAAVENRLEVFESSRKIDYPYEYLYDALIRSTEDYLYLCNMKTSTFRYSPAQVRDFDMPGEIIKEPLFFWKKIVHPDDWMRFYKANMEITENRRDSHSVEFRAKQKNGRYVWLRCRGSLIRDEYGEPRLFAGIMQKMGKQNMIDPLTQLFNHQRFMKQMKDRIRDSSLERMSVTILDVDNFRRINEMYDRNFGDGILRTLAQIIQGILPENAGLFRLEKDQMGILMGNGGEKECRDMFLAIQRAILKMKEWKKRKVQVQLSAGSAFYPKDAASAQELYQYADYAMQQAKLQGKNRMVIFDEELLIKKNQRLDLVRKLRDAVQHGFRGFYMNYQPQVDGKTKEITGVEALMRFRDTEGTRISPLDFIPVMETEGMIYAVGMWAMREAIRQGKKWLVHKREFTISVNVSALQIAEEFFLADLRRILEEEQFPCKNLILEITESCTVQNIDIFRDRFEQLKEMGIRVAMDDFGTGYSSLEILKNAPFDVVKIDSSFVRGILKSKFDATFISLVVELCHDADILVCLEGVETEEEYDFLKKMQLDCIQGYYFGRPVEPQVITKMIA